MSHNAHPDHSGQRFELNFPAPRYTGICTSTFKGPGIFVIPLPVCLAWRAHITSFQLIMAALCSKHSPAWSTPELLHLLALWGEEAVKSQLSFSCRNFDTYSQISRGMLDKGYEQGMHQCHVKIKELRQVYQKARESNRCSSAALETCHFYKELDTILSGDPTFTIKIPVDTCGGQRLETADSGLNLKDEVVDKEVELEDEMGQATGASGTVASQDLFLTQAGSSQSQQSVCGAHDAGEGNSDVAFRGTHYTPAESLCQVRKLRRSKEDVL
ncbi:uncharacterized protein RBU57_010405 isoform 1-T5 [Macrochelys suwanniensis]